MDRIATDFETFETFVRRVEPQLRRALSGYLPADERLLLVDLETTDTTDLGRFGGWESGVADGLWTVDAGWTDDLAAAELTVSVYDFLTGEVVRTVERSAHRDRPRFRCRRSSARFHRRRGDSGRCRGH